MNNDIFKKLSFSNQEDSKNYQYNHFVKKNFQNGTYRIETSNGHHDHHHGHCDYHHGHHGHHHGHHDQHHGHRDYHHSHHNHHNDQHHKHDY